MVLSEVHRVVGRLPPGKATRTTIVGEHRVFATRSPFASEAVRSSFVVVRRRGRSHWPWPFVFNVVR